MKHFEPAASAPYYFNENNPSPSRSQLTGYIYYTIGTLWTVPNNEFTNGVCSEAILLRQSTHQPQLGVTARSYISQTNIVTVVLILTF